MNKLDYYEAKEFVKEKWIPEIYNLFERLWPETHVKNTTKNKDIYDKANPHIVKWETLFMNKLMDLPETPLLYELNKENGYSYTYIEKMFTDFINLQFDDDKLKFLIQYT